MADSIFEFTDTPDCEFIDWDCVWTSWTYTEADVILTVFGPMGLKYLMSPMSPKYVFEPLK